MTVKVVNDNKHEYFEKYRGKTITIPPGGSIDMDLNEATHFLGTNPGIAAYDAHGLQDPRTYKMLRIEKPGDVRIEAQKEYRCMADGKVFHTQAELDAYIEENHVESMVDEKAKEKITAKRRGRPPKGAKDDAGTD